MSKFVLVRFHFDRLVTSRESHALAGHYMAGESAAFPEPLAATMVHEGVAACDDFQRVRFVAPVTIEDPSPFAGRYERSPQLYVFDIETAALLVEKGAAVDA